LSVSVTSPSVVKTGWSLYEKC